MSATTTPFAVHEAAFLDVLGSSPRLERVIATDAHEGPVYVAAEDALYFTTVPKPGATGPVVDIRCLPLASLRLDTGRAERADANTANGMALAPDGRLLVCEQDSMTRAAALTLVDRTTGATETLADAVAGRPLNSPNDVIVARDGAV
jgi:gluconolactonase